MSSKIVPRTDYDDEIVMLHECLHDYNKLLQEFRNDKPYYKNKPHIVEHVKKCYQETLERLLILKRLYREKVGCSWKEAYHGEVECVDQPESYNFLDINEWF